MTPLSERVSPKLIEFTTTQQQTEILQSFLELQSCTAVAKKLKLTRSTVFSSLKRLIEKGQLQGHSPAHNWNDSVPEGFFAKRMSTFVKREDYNQWIIAETTPERVTALVHEFAQGLTEDIKRLPPIDPPQVQIKDKMNIYVLADLHFGLLADKEETNGPDWDCKYAVTEYTRNYDELIGNMPDAEAAIVVNLGDLLHVDDESGATKASKNKLDLDSRHWKIARVAASFMRHAIDRALQKHGRVKYINVKGNHDPISADLLGMSIETAYEREPRLEVDNSPGAFHYHKFGRTLMGFTHGHTCKPEKLGDKMMEDRRELISDSQRNWWLTGHIHHWNVKEFGWYVFESFRSPVAKDAWHSDSGYTAERDMVAICLSENGKKTQRHQVSF